jgi:hypothetical protein
MVVEVTLHDRLEPRTGVRHRIAYSLSDLLLNLLQLRPHALADRRALHRERRIPVHPGAPNMLGTPKKNAAALGSVRVSLHHRGFIPSPQFG